MKALVISGGGSKGAYAGGVAEFLLRDCKRDYDLFIGTSTGSLLTPLLAAGQLEKARAAFTQVTQNDVFKVCPFIIKKKRGQILTSINHFGIVRMFLRGEKTFGDSSNLRKYISRFFSKEDFQRIKERGKRVIVTVSNLTNEQVEYKSSDDYEYETFCDWIWASANLLPFMSLLVKDGIEYGDGGFGNLIPVQKAINEGATWVDVIALRPVNKTKSLLPSRNAFSLLNKTYDFMLNQIGLDDLLIGNLEAKQKQVDIHYFHTPRILAEQTFVFDPEQLTEWWSEGCKNAKHKTPERQCLEFKVK